jgi:hypothetical protein
MTDGITAMYYREQNQKKMRRSERMIFELYEWFMMEVLEDALLKKSNNDEMQDVCLQLSKTFEEQLLGLSTSTLEELYYDTFPETDIDCGGLL